MLKTTTTAPAAKNTTAKESLTIAFQDFNGVFLAKISNLKGKETFAYGENEVIAETNAKRNYNIKFHNAQSLYNEN